MNRFQLKLVSILSLTTTFVIADDLKGSENITLSKTQPNVVANLSPSNQPQKTPDATDSNRNVYIIQLEDKPVATYDGHIKGLKATSNKVTGARKLNVNSKSSKAYRKYLKQKQDNVLSASNMLSNVKYDYQLVFNGMAVEMTGEEAAKVAKMSGVKNVSKERMLTLNTDVGPELINADTIWNGPPNNVPHSQGEGIVVAILDSGINYDHPSFADIGGDGYDHTNPLGTGNYIPGSYCDTNPDFCNDKLIGAWSFVNEALTPDDSDGHGSHTASTAAGNVVKGATIYAPTATLSRDISGVAPHANIIAYDVCIETCPGSALLAAINQVVVDASNLPDGIHALNYSISGGEDPYNDIIELGFLNATAAGVYVAASAGNSGPGASTNGHNGPWVSTTAAMTHGRQMINKAVNMTSDGSTLADIQGLGFTSGYGPARIINSADLEEQYPGSTLCGLGSIGDNIAPWPPGTFNGEIVACTRGTFGRVEKGVNVLSAGAGGYILMDNGSGIVGDSHVLPAVHINQADSAILSEWLANNDNTMGGIEGYTIDVNSANADIIAGFSSRGPNVTHDVIKPDVGGPGVSILAAAPGGDDYMFLSGTSMSSPHNAGAGAIVSAARPDWTPYAVKSAIMMTSNNSTGVKEDGVTSADPFDFGAGRVDLSRAAEAGLVLNETPENFYFANPDLGGDPKTLNLASMQDSKCFLNCSWTRTLTNTTNHTIHVNLSIENDNNVNFTITPAKLKLKKGQEASFTVMADTTLASDWNFAQVNMQRKGDGPDLHMPIAVKAVVSTNPQVFNKSVDKAIAVHGDTLTYQISLTNGQLDGQIDLNDMLPQGVDFVPGSESAMIENGTTITPFSEDGGKLSWSGTLDKSGLDGYDTGFLYGYVPLSNYTTPFSLPANCDEGGFALNVPSFIYNGKDYNQVIWSVNGTLEAGLASASVSGFQNVELPDPSGPNNLLAPWWTDLNLCAGGNWYTLGLYDGVNNYTVFEWENVPLFGDNETTATFQIWIVDGTDFIFFVYGNVAGDIATIGAENSTGDLGFTRYFNGNTQAPMPNDEILIRPTPGGTATFSFEATTNCKADVVVNQADISNDGNNEKAIAVTEITDCK